MDRVARWITEHSRLIVAFFAAAAIICAVLFFGVKVNYDMTAYLPADAESTVALQIMQEEFSASVPNARVMVPGLTDCVMYEMLLKKIFVPMFMSTATPRTSRIQGGRCSRRCSARRVSLCR